LTLSNPAGEIGVYPLCFDNINRPRIRLSMMAGNPTGLADNMPGQTCVIIAGGTSRVGIWSS
jgi:hypothetical protein